MRTTILLLWAIVAVSINCKDLENIAVETIDDTNPDLIDYTDASPDDYTLHKLTVEKNLTNAETDEIVEMEINAPNRTARIIGGSEASISDYPYFAYIESLKPDGTTKVYCGGAILSEIWVLTAATCVIGTTGTTVYAGIDTTPSATDVSKTVVKIYVPSKFRYNFKIHNIALLRLSSPFTFNSYISNIKLTKNTASLDNAYLLTMGMGANTESTDPGTYLQTVEIKQISRNNCDALTSFTFYQYPINTVCLETSSGTKNLCYVDIGGPVVYTYSGDSSAVLVGINSEIVSCTSVYPSAYTKVQPYVTWITKVTKLSFV